MKRKLAAGLLVPVVFALVAACGGGDGGGNKVASAGTGGPSSSSSDKPKGADLSAEDEDKMREFTKCMRENGVDMPDPKGGGMAVTVPEGGEEAMKKADEACKKLLPNGGEYKEPSQEEKDKMREQAKCMREHGIDMPDPDFSGTGSGRAVEMDDTEKFNQAMKDCGMGDGGMVAAPAVPPNG